MESGENSIIGEFQSCFMSIIRLPDIILDDHNQEGAKDADHFDAPTEDVKCDEWNDPLFINRLTNIHI